MDRNLLGYKGIKPTLAIVLLLTLVQSVSIVLLARWLAEVLSALFAGEPLHTQYTKFMMFLGAFLIRHIMNFIQQKISYAFAERTGGSLRKQVMEKLFQLGPRFAKQEGTGNLVTLVMEGTAKFRNYLELIVPRMAGMSIIPWVILAYIFMQDITSGIILILSMPILIVFMILIGLAARKHTEKQLDTYRTLSNHFVDSLRGLETLKLLGQSRSHGDTIARVSDRYRSATMRTLRVAFLSSFALDFFTMLSVAVVAVGLGLRLVNGDLALVTGLTVLILAPEYFLPVRMVGADFHATLDGKEAGAAMQLIIDEPLSQESAAQDAGQEEKKLNWSHDSSLALSGVGIQHKQEGPHSLDEVTLDIHGMGKIGIIGASGAGKSTLIDVLGGFLKPSEGTVDLDGQILSSLTTDAWRQLTTYIPQHPYIFSSTLADNIRFYAPDAGALEVEQAVAAAGLTELVSSLPHGAEEMIGGGGRQLSGGQEQRVALARAFLSDRPVMLLDEPTAHLDIETEYELKQTMLRLFEEKLVFLATHRLHWMPDMDLIIVLEHGRVAETGTHEELIARKGAYYELIQSQLEGA
ncbi:thiol reductant ABC exporter subunit CydD [Paenibacillus sp. HJL G12]|uniref:Thiol reductant ABC exporter subunit CydD n=1 Tax=Paenibacillus dendrobii TaxID=2691084 RepID=A0A7X3IQM1_9BACL|nr:thiol reductant ABC exporter subunit CydD [Paenibacillus dendrobii]MWV46457.1 thiol reductant ABC exporter subunit CydD [Paenibacillus dendrobii]